MGNVLGVQRFSSFPHRVDAGQSGGNLMIKKFGASIALATLMAVVPAVAKEKGAKMGDDKVWNENKKMLQQEGQNREPGEDGMFQGKPVVQGPANWHGKVSSGGDASAGASSGEAGTADRE
jgi:hypothetical protein